MVSFATKAKPMKNSHIPTLNDPIHSPPECSRITACSLESSRSVVGNQENVNGEKPLHQRIPFLVKYYPPSEALLERKLQQITRGTV